MKLGDKVIFRGSAQSWAGLAPGATHFHGVLENTETGWEEMSKRGFKTEAKALEWCARVWVGVSNPRESLLWLGASQTDMCL